jgi:hypothetical protein
VKISIHQQSANGGEVVAVSAGDKLLEFHVEQPLHLENYDFAVWPLLLYAMQHKLPLEIGQPVTSGLLFNAELLQRFLHRYLNLAPVEIRAEQLITVEPPLVPRTLLPFSGGVDSTFSLLYNHFELNRKIDGAMVVRGLDIFDEEEYRLCCERCQSFLDLTGTKLICVRTNLREHFVTPLGWKLHSDFALAGMLHLFHQSFGHAFISGDGDAGLLSVRQCFQTPFLNERLFHHFSNDHLLIQNFEGPDFTKIEKIAYLSQYAEVRQNLRVCWKYRKHSNCGQCTKCVMTQMAFIAVLGSVPPCFPQPLTEEALHAVFILVRESKTTDPDSPAIILPKEFTRILRTAAKYAASHPLLNLLKTANLQLPEGALVR